MWDKLIQIFFQFMFDKNLMYLLPPVLFNLSLTASIVIVAVLIVRFFLRKAPRVWSYALWAVVAFRLICPVSFSSDFSLLSIVDAPAAESGLVSGMVEYVPINIVHTRFPSVDLMIPELNETINSQLPQGDEQYFGDPLEGPVAMVSWAWMFGFSVMLLWALSSWLNLRHKLRTAVLLKDNVFQSEQVGSPFILGLFRPKIYIPFGLDETTLNYVLAHEKYHIKRLDHIVKVFAFILLTIHWFNPLCWLAFHLMSKDMEMSCDEKVLSKENNVRTEYSTVLLSFATNRRFPSPSPLAFGETGAKSRIKNALNWKRPKVWVTLIAAILCIAVIAACAANPKEKDPSEVEIKNPYDWTSTVKQDDIYGVSIQLLNTEEPAAINLSSDGIRELVTCLNKVTPADLYTGRGIPAQIKVVVTLSNEETVILHYGTTYIEILYPGVTSSNGIWMIRDTELKSLLSEWSVQLQQQYNSMKSSQEDTITAAMTLWEYAPLLSSRYPAFPFQFTFPYTHIEATCTAGELIGYDDHDGSSYPTGTSLTIPSGSKLYWLPMGNGKTDPLYASSASISFTAYDDSKPTYSGTLNISQLDTDHKSDFIQAIYGATLSSSSLMMYQNPTDYGGVIYSVSIAATGGSDLPESTFIQNASLSEARAAALDQRFQKDVAPNNFSCHSHEVLTWHTSRSDGLNTLAEYLLVYYTEYDCSSSGVSLLHEETVPVIMVYGMDANNAYTLLDYRELTDEEVWAQFPLAYVDEALDKDRKNQTMAPACYAAALEFSRTLYETAPINVYDLSENPAITLTAGQLSTYRFKTNSKRIFIDFDRSDGPIEIQLYASDANEPLLFFSSGSSKLSSCSFSNLTSAREYYFTAQCPPDTVFTVHD